MAGTLNLDFENTEIAFEQYTDHELKRTYRLFKMMNNPGLVKMGSGLAILISKLKIPIFDPLIRATIFDHFCGGINLLDCQTTIDRLYKNKTMSILDYGAEAHDSESDFDRTCSEIVKAVQFGASNASVPVVSMKISSIARNALLEKWQGGKNDLTSVEVTELDKVRKRMHKIIHLGSDMEVGIFIDAEESWVQESMDALADEMMEAYNKKRVIVYNTYQLYRKDRLEFLRKSFERSVNKNYFLGAKLVRGAYMVKERVLAAEKGYPSPIHDSKEDSDQAFDEGIEFCVNNYNRISLCNASHNANSAYKMAKYISDRSIPRNHSHLNFCQLMGMSDNITFNLARQGFNVAKYVVYGPIQDVIPYLIRRAQENTSITGDVSRELGFILTEMNRRKVLSNPK